MKTSCKFVTSPDILFAKGKHSVANATVLVAIPSPEVVKQIVQLVSNSFSKLQILSHFLTVR